MLRRAKTELQSYVEGQQLQWIINSADTLEVAPCTVSPAHLPCRGPGQQPLYRICRCISPDSTVPLQLPVPRGEESSGVTPQIFARPLVAAVVAHIRQLVRKEVRADHGCMYRLCRSIKPSQAGQCDAH